jgi:hypothetical protein
MSHPMTTTLATMSTNITIPTVTVGLDRVHTYPGFATDCPCGAAGFSCTRFGTIDWCPTNSLGLHYANAAPGTYPSDHFLTVFTYSLIAFLALRSILRTSTSALIGLCLIIGGLVYDIRLGFPGAEATVATTTVLFSTPVIANELNTPSATAASRLAKGQPGPFGEGCEGQTHSHAVPRPTFPGLWLVMLVVVACWLGMAVGQLRDAAMASPVDLPGNDGDGVDSPSAKIASAPAMPVEEASNTIIHRAPAERFFSDKVEVKRSQPAVKQKKEKSIMDVRNEKPGPIKVAVLVTFVVLCLMLFPMALAEPTQTSTPVTALTLSSPSPSPTVFNATGTFNQTLDIQDKDRPQTWYWNPHSGSSERASMRSWLMTIPLLLMGFFLLPAPAAGEKENDKKPVDNAVMAREAAPQDTSPIWITYYSTTTVWLPVVTVTAPPVANSAPSTAPISEAGLTWQTAQPAIGTVCTEKNPAVCPIVLGRKAWKPVTSGGSRVWAAKMGVLAVIVGVGLTVAMLA